MRADLVFSELPESGRIVWILKDQPLLSTTVTAFLAVPTAFFAVPTPFIAVNDTDGAKRD